MLSVQNHMKSNLPCDFFAFKESIQPKTLASSLNTSGGGGGVYPKVLVILDVHF